jgi:hypothetical protein
MLCKKICNSKLILMTKFYDFTIYTHCFGTIFPKVHINQTSVMLYILLVKHPFKVSFGNNKFK